MNVRILCTSYDRKSLRPLKSAVIGYVEITEDTCYQPFVELIYGRIVGDQTKTDYKEGKVQKLAEKI